MALKSRISFVVPEQLQKDMKERVIRDGYGMRGKSLWITEAVNSLLVIKGYIELVGFSDVMDCFEKTETVVIDYALKLKLEDAILAIRRQYPVLEGVKSRIFRTAIMQRVLRS